LVLQRNESAIVQASYKGHDAVVQLLAASGANVNVKDNVSPVEPTVCARSFYMDILDFPSPLFRVAGRDDGAALGVPQGPHQDPAHVAGARRGCQHQAQRE
jgi:hypothetical protein